MGLFNKKKEQIFLKENSAAETQLERLNKSKPLLNSERLAIIEQDIKYTEYGIAGEKNIEFELKNSHMPLYVLHDIYLKWEELSAQIDYLVFTPKIFMQILKLIIMGNSYEQLSTMGRRKRKAFIHL